MTLTADDRQAINQLVTSAIKTTVQPMIDKAVDSLAQSTAAGFTEVHDRLTEHDKQFQTIRADLNRIEQKLDATIDRVDDYEVRLRRLEPKAV